MSNKIIGSYLPVFSGFYNNIYWDEENDIDTEIDCYNDRYGLEFTYDDFNYKYQDYQNDISKEIFNSVKAYLLEYELISNACFDNLISPREYNYYNDSINCDYEISKDNLRIIKKYLDDNIEEFADYIKKNYTSCSGFTSHYSNNYKDWINELTWDNFENLSHKLGQIFNFILEKVLEITEENIYWDVSDCDVYFGGYMELDINNLDEERLKKVKEINDLEIVQELVDDFQEIKNS